jgi:hypothetical protein
MSLDRRPFEDDELTVDLEVIASATERADLVVLPERIRERGDSVKIAPVRREARDLQRFAHENGRTVAFAIPDGVETAAYEEHAAALVLPIIVFGAGIALNIGCNLVASWIWEVWGPKSDPEDLVYVRLARRLGDGSMEMLEARGSVDDVVRILREPQLEPREED